MDESPFTETSDNLYQIVGELIALRQKLYQKAKHVVSVCLLVKSARELYAGNPHVRFDEGEG